MHGTPLTNHRFIVLLTLLVAAAACIDDTRVTSPEEVTKEGVTEPAGNQSFVAAVTCTANVTEGELSCGPVPVIEDRADEGPQRVILGGQDLYVTLASPVVSYDPGSEIFQADVTVENLIAQGLGSPNGGLTTTGIRVFHHSGPTTTGGTGIVTVENADGTADFTGVGQPYHFYDVYLPQDTTTDPKTWEWNVPTTVSTFVFEVFVAADVLGENGYVDVTPGSAFIYVGDVAGGLSATVRDVVDRPIGGTVTWTSSNTSVATVNPITAVITGVSAGVVDIIASTGGSEAHGFSRITVDPFVPGFQIELHFLTPMTASQEAAFNNAVARWESLITGDLTPSFVQRTHNLCLMPIDEAVDDLAINVVVEPIDGVGKVLGSAGPCIIRTPGGVPGLPIYGRMRFDIADLAALEADNQLEDVILHEMGHVLGIGTVWDIMGLLSDDNGPLTNCFPIPDGEPPPPLTTDPYFTGSQAIAAFNSNGGGSYVGNKVPVEETWYPGTRCGHWRESVLDDELMTGFIESPPAPPPPQIWMPLSEATVKSLADIGYTIAASGWDTWTCPFCASPAVGAPVADATEQQFLNDIWLGPLYGLDEEGRITLVRPDRRR